MLEQENVPLSIKYAIPPILLSRRMTIKVRSFTVLVLYDTGRHPIKLTHQLLSFHLVLKQHLYYNMCSHEDQAWS